MAQSGNTVYVGEGVDEFLFPVSLYERIPTGERYAAYSLETWEARCAFVSSLLTIEERVSGRQQTGSTSRPTHPGA